MPPTASPSSSDRQSVLLAMLAGAIFGVVFVKLGSPVILAEKILPPASRAEWMLSHLWPIQWGYLLLGGFLLISVALAWRLPSARPGASPAGWRRWIPRLLVFWLGWQALAALQTVEPRLTRLVLPHFLACAACFVAGRFVVARTRHPEWFWLWLALALGLVVIQGFDQRLGGLDEMRRQFEQSPELRGQFDTPEFRARMASQRVFSTFFYPNALAGGLLLLLPAAAAWTWRRLAGWNQYAALAATSGVLAAGLLCLYWSGSKAGWLIAVLLAVMALALGRWPRRLKVALVAGLLLLGLLGFFLKYSGYLVKGAPSAGARLDYWKVALRTAVEHPLLGTGPGTFSAVYRVKKPPEAEMTHLAHNDYLQQAADSGWPGGLAYLLLIGGLLCLTRPAQWSAAWPSAAWLGVAGWALQGWVEFGLYIPALAWPAFLLLGWLRAATSQPASAS